MLEFLRRGQFEVLGPAPGRAALAAVLGPSTPLANSWRYGPLEFVFSQDRARDIVFDASHDTSHQLVEPSLLAARPMFMDLSEQLAAYGITFEELVDADSPTLFLPDSEVFLTFEFDGLLSTAFRHYHLTEG